VRLDAAQRASFLKELAVLRARLEECDAGRNSRQSNRVP
jgi:hypothetical protein